MQFGTDGEMSLGDYVILSLIESGQVIGCLNVCKMRNCYLDLNYSF
jgi:hypothetical protein